MPKKEKKVKAAKKTKTGKPKKVKVENDFKSSETKILKQITNTLMMKNSYTGYYFIVNDVVHPVIFDEDLKPTMKMKDAWDYVCKTWLNDLYGQDVSDLLPYIIRGKVTDSSLTIGLNSGFYIEEIKKMFRIQNNVKIKIDKSLGIATKISRSTFKVLNATLQQGVPYFDHLPWSIRLSFRENGTKEQRNEALYQIIKTNEKARKNSKS